MVDTGRGPLPGTSASGMVATKPRIASSKSSRLANGRVFAMSALAFSVAGSGALGAIWPYAAKEVTVIAAAMAMACLRVFDMDCSDLSECNIEFGQRHGANALAGRCEVGVEHGWRSNGDCRLADAAPEAT